jgi:ABC-type branched-subunit amino acid transport system ATPase component
MIEHHMDVVAGLCDRATVLNFGKTLAEATVAEIKNNKQVVEAYLGEEH